MGDIPEIVLPLMKPFINKVEDTIKPGLTMLSWTSLNIEACEFLNVDLTLELLRLIPACC